MKRERVLLFGSCWPPDFACLAVAT